MNEPKFANILLAGPCNLSCPDCIGQIDDVDEQINTLDTYPLPGLKRLAARLSLEGISQISLTGINTEPMLYKHQPALLAYLRQHLPGVKVSLHTNGTLILAKINLFNQYDRATVSIPSFDPETCRKMTGSPKIVDLEAIVSSSRIPIKISTLLTHNNLLEIPAIIEQCRELGIRRMVLRKLYGGSSPEVPVSNWTLQREFAGNPVYDAKGIEVTVWDFDRTQLHCLNLFPNGEITDRYLLKRERSNREQLANRHLDLEGWAKDITLPAAKVMEQEIQQSITF